MLLKFQLESKEEGEVSDIAYENDVFDTTTTTVDVTTAGVLPVPPLSEASVMPPLLPQAPIKEKKTEAKTPKVRVACVFMCVMFMFTK